jgi:transposase-like protein
LPSVAAARQADPLPNHVAEQVVVGVSTRGYKRSLEPVDESIQTRGESKSNISRALIESTADKLAAFLSRKLDELELVAMFIDGTEIGGHAVVIALGVIADGTKGPLGVWCGSTENHTVA